MRANLDVESGQKPFGGHVVGHEALLSLCNAPVALEVPAHEATDPTQHQGEVPEVRASAAKKGSTPRVNRRRPRMFAVKGLRRRGEGSVTQTSERQPRRRSNPAYALIGASVTSKVASHFPGRKAK